MLVVFSLTVLADTKIIIWKSFKGFIYSQKFCERNFAIFADFRQIFKNLFRKARKFSGTVIHEKLS